MKKDEIKRELSNFKAAIEKKPVEINVMLVDQNNQRKKRYKGFMLKTRIADLEETLKNSFTYLTDELDKRTLDIYDLEISVDNSVQTINKADVIHSDEILNEIDVEYTDDNVVSENTDLKNIKFIVIQIYANQKSLYLFKKYVHQSSAYKTSQKYILSGGLLKPFSKKIITINSIVDAMLLGDTYYVFNRNTFNSIFAYKDVFARILNENSEMIRTSGLLTEPDQFVADCESDGRYLPRLAKVILAQGFDEVSKKKAEIPNVIKEFDLSLKASAEGKIVYRGKEDIPELLNLLLRHYVIDALTSNKMIAAAIQKYQAGGKRKE